MRMAPDHLLADRLHHIRKSEAALLLGDLRVVDHLQQQVAQLLAKLLHVLVLDRLCDLVGLLQGVRQDASEGLLLVPGTAILGVAQSCDDGDEIGDRIVSVHENASKDDGSTRP
jgi:hypothetical protein